MLKETWGRVRAGREVGGEFWAERGMRPGYSLISLLSCCS